jgi:hypothetical protein
VGVEGQDRRPGGRQGVGHEIGERPHLLACQKCLFLAELLVEPRSAPLRSSAPSPPAAPRRPRPPDTTPSTSRAHPGRDTAQPPPFGWSTEAGSTGNSCGPESSDSRPGIGSVNRSLCRPEVEGVFRLRLRWRTTGAIMSSMPLTPGPDGCRSRGPDRGLPGPRPRTRRRRARAARVQPTLLDPRFVRLVYDAPEERPVGRAGPEGCLVAAPL